MAKDGPCKSRRPTIKPGGVGDGWRQLPQHPSVWYSFRSWVMPDSSGQRWRSAHYVGDEADVTGAGIMLDEPSLRAVRIITRCPTKAQPSRIHVWYHLREWAGHDVEMIDRLPGATSKSAGANPHPPLATTLAVVLTHPRFDRAPVQQQHTGKPKGTINFRAFMENTDRELSRDKRSQLCRSKGSSVRQVGAQQSGAPDDPALRELLEIWSQLSEAGRSLVACVALGQLALAQADAKSPS
jgi:hypothetical protein